MERTLNDVHGIFNMVMPPKRKLDIKDYSEKELLLAIGDSERFMKEFRREKFNLYSGMAFPDWKRASIKNMKLPYYSVHTSTQVSGPAVWKELNSVSVEETNILRSMDFEGDDEKFVLLGDVFFTNGLFAKTESGRDYIEPLIVTEDSKGSGSNIRNNVFHILENSRLTVILESKAGDFIL